MTSPTRTVQLRRYSIVEGAFADFMTWFETLLLPAKRGFGFVVEFVYPLPESNELVWAVSAPGGDRAELVELDAVWQTSEARAAAFAGQPKRIAASRIDLVEPLA